MGGIVNSSRREDNVFLGLVFFSGFCGLVYEVVFTKLLTYVFGVTAYAVSTVLAAFMAGLALGSFGFGRLADRTPQPLRLYAVLELLIGLYCVSTPWLYLQLGELYAALHQRFGLSPAAVTAIRYALCWGFILVPTVLMGGTLPAAAKVLTRRREEIGANVSALYAINTLGAAAGTLVATYWMIFHLGLDGSVYFAAALNTAIFVVAWQWARQRPPQAVPAEPVATLKPAHSQALGSVAVLAVAFGAGTVSLAYEVVWTHVLAQAIGNSIYAFGTMLFTLLLGMGLGSFVVSRRQPGTGRSAVWAAAIQWLAAIAVLAGLPLWDKIPLVFRLGRSGGSWSALLVFLPLGLLLAAWPLLVWTRVRRSRRSVTVVLAVMLVAVWWGRDRLQALPSSETVAFWVAESVRFVCSVNMLVWPTLLMGATFPLLIQTHAAKVEDLGVRVGTVYFWNTAGAIAGSLIGGYALLPWLGSQSSLKTLAWGNWVVGSLCALILAGGSWRLRWRWTLAVTGAAAALTLLAPSWNLRVLNSGANVYFDSGRPIDEILFWAEDVHGGVTTVVREGRTRTLLTNGKFEGNDGSEMQAQDNFSHVPMLYVRRFDRALVIGLGTGRTLGALTAYPFADIDVVELAPNVVTAARSEFGHINHGALDDPRVHLHVTDGRNWLQLTTHRYDAITIEVSSIWFAGAANLYNREFYEWAARRLQPSGVLQQWVQLHHLRPCDLQVLLNTVRQVFPYVQLFVSSHQGTLIASHAPFQADYTIMAARNHAAAYELWLRTVPLQNLFTLFGGLLVDEQGINDALANLSDEPRISSDLQPHLEYATPRGNFVPYDTRERIVCWLKRFQPSVRPPIVNVPGPSEEHVLAGCIAFGRGDLATARTEFERAKQVRESPDVADLLRRLESSQNSVDVP